MWYRKAIQVIRFDLESCTIQTEVEYLCFLPNIFSKCRFGILMELSVIEVKDITLIPSHPIDWKKDIRIYVTNLS